MDLESYVMVLRARCLAAGAIAFVVLLWAGSDPARADGNEQAASSETVAKVAVKKSRNEICHDKSSPSFDQVLRFEPFETITACLESGGRLPKGADKDVQTLPVRKSRKGICHDASSANYATMKYFETFQNMDACVKSGGRPRK